MIAEAGYSLVAIKNTALPVPFCEKSARIVDRSDSLCLLKLFVSLLISLRTIRPLHINEAMDGLSAAASVIAVVQLLEGVVTLCCRYGKAVKNAKYDIERLSGELDSLKTILGDTQELLEGPNGARLKTSQAFCDTFQDCSSQLGELESALKDKLENGKRARMMTSFGFRALKWPFESGKIDSAIHNLNKFRETLSAGLNIDQTYVAAFSLAAR